MHKGQRGLYIDVETGGLRPECDALLQVGVIVFEVCEGHLKICSLENIRVIVPDSLYICRRALMVQGKSFADVDKSPGPCPREEVQVARTLRLMVDDEFGRDGDGTYPRIWAHNAAFDAGFLHHLEKRYTSDIQPRRFAAPPGHGWSCTKAYWKRLQAEGKAPAEIGSSLDHIAAHFGIDRPSAHDALADCEVGVQVLQKMLQMDGKL